ncbi:uncharacterized protein LOC111345235 [Stylophora pistillata]|uniref:uncharacterized protein LOC111345235 n=1 Tax=Stylophora pistillata TaxID=50429 RepID=UPI000C04C2A9|nr:uncharacterized protein LOC111345235 [Stylophora pistillata]
MLERIKPLVCFFYFSMVYISWGYPDCGGREIPLPLFPSQPCSTTGRVWHFDFSFPTEYEITAVQIYVSDQVTGDSKVEWILFQALLSNTYVTRDWFKPRHGFGELLHRGSIIEARNGSGKKLVLSKPVITRSLRIVLGRPRHTLRTRICFLGVVFGCEATPQGCIMPGSPVLFKEEGKYLKGRFSLTTRRSGWEIVYGKKFIYNNKNIILDEGPPSELLKGTVVVGKDSEGNLREGKAKQMCLYPDQCTIETNGAEWQSKFDDVRLLTGKLCK